ncbi:hypothetical protein CLV63_107199 [Murinocardiopsis flavida]|uniref:Uncharacterized protein n=1 Tax=Murinocardiopsis flavida TaxID=645275 RepID=A0A2P8DKR5_9ACTN|nr:hypothetical protein [Murinocardiopsis flavida]PSK97806.1 hypothetical protein CLV63_107199 [Murinocardiopsis flavida]
MKTYQAHAKRWKHEGELHIDGVGVTQAHRINEAEAMAREYVALDLAIPEGSFDVVVKDSTIDAETVSLR